jgi:hypothetical protein
LTSGTEDSESRLGWRGDFIWKAIKSSGRENGRRSFAGRVTFAVTGSACGESPLMNTLIRFRGLDFLGVEDRLAGCDAE